MSRRAKERARAWGGGGGAAVCAGERGGWGEPGAWRGGEGWLEGRQMVESEGVPFLCGLGDDPQPVRLRADPLWLCLSPAPQNRPFPPSPSPLCDFLQPPSAPPTPSHTHTVSCQLPPPVRCKCLAGIRPPGDLRPWETRVRAQF